MDPVGRGEGLVKEGIGRGQDPIIRTGDVWERIPRNTGLRPPKN